MLTRRNAGRRFPWKPIKRPLDGYGIRQYLAMLGSMDPATQQAFELQARRQRQAILTGELVTLSDDDLQARQRQHAMFSEEWVRIEQVIELRKKDAA